MGFNIESTEFPIKNFHATPRAVIGWGAYRQAAEEANAIGMNNVLIVTTGLRGTGIIDEVKGVLEHGGVTVKAVYDGVTSNPKDHEVHAAHKMFKENKCEGIVSVGGGSSHDCAKAVRMVDAHDGKSITEFGLFCPCTEPITIPQLAITTTAGTGSEISWASVITDTTKVYKMCIFDPTIVASRAIVDPALMRTMPQALTATTGFDALTHAVEAYVSRLGVRASQGLGIHAIKLINEGLRKAYANPHNAEARECMAWAQFTAGHAFNSAGLGIVHSMAHTLGALFDSPHGLCNAIGLVATCRYNMVACPEKFADIAQALGEDTRGMGTMEAAECGVDAIERLRSDVGITETFADLGVKEEHLDKAAQIAMNDICTQGNPRDVDNEVIKTIFRQCMKPGANGK